MTDVDHVPAERLARFAADTLAAAGLHVPHAEVVARSLVWADLRGVGSHGVSRLPLYVGWLRSGEMNPAARLKVSVRLPALLVLDADRAPGAVALDEAAQRVAPVAREFGVGAILVRGTTHTGALGAYTAGLASQGLFALAMASSGPNMMYHGSSRIGASTAPLSMAAPRAGAAPIVLDMASGATALGRILQARREGTLLPPDVAADADGRPTRDPAQAVAPLPLGGAKGSGLALLIELACSSLAGASILAPALLASPERQPHRQNALLLAIDYARVTPPEGAAAAVEELAGAIHALPTAGDEPVLLPGERGAKRAEESLAQGIRLTGALRRELEALAGGLSVVVPWQTSTAS